MGCGIANKNETTSSTKTEFKTDSKEQKHKNINLEQKETITELINESKEHIHPIKLL